MAKAGAIEQTLAKLHALRACLGAPEARAELRRALKNSTNLIVAKAAGIVGEAQIAELEDDLVAAFERFMKNPAASDRGCAALTALAKALYEIGARSEDVFLRGVRHVQLEASYGGPVDVAVELRGHSALGLVRMGHREAMSELADLLGDSEAQARMAAARAIAYAGRDEGAMLLRLKLHCGDKEPQVIEECMIALVKLAPAKAVPLLEKCLAHRDPAHRAAAALALGESRLAEAAAILQRHWKSESDADAIRALALGLAMVRRPEATEFLIARLSEELPQTAADIVEALAMYKHDEVIRAKVRDVVEARNDFRITRAMKGW